MEFGTRPGGTDAEAFREGFDHAKLREDVGLDSVWLAEFHFMPARSVLLSHRRCGCVGPFNDAGAHWDCCLRLAADQSAACC